MKSKGLSRRDVLKSVTHTAALATFVPASALGREGTPPPSERLSLGAIGVGAQGFPDMKSFARMKDVRVTALCDVNQRNIQRAREFLADQYGADDVRTQWMGKQPAGIPNPGRSERVPESFEMIGYQADMGQHYWFCLYDERRHKLLAGPC